jgi:hypothetical protein
MVSLDLRRGALTGIAMGNKGITDPHYLSPLTVIMGRSETLQFFNRSVSDRANTGSCFTKKKKLRLILWGLPPIGASFRLKERDLEGVNFVSRTQSGNKLSDVTDDFSYH